jgi:hypothetical protein
VIPNPVVAPLIFAAILCVRSMCEIFRAQGAIILEIGHNLEIAIRLRFARVWQGYLCYVASNKRASAPNPTISH